MGIINAFSCSWTFYWKGGLFQGILFSVCQWFVFPFHLWPSFTSLALSGKILTTESTCSMLTDPLALRDLAGMSRVPAWQLQPRRKRLSVCSSCWQHNDWHQRQHRHRVHGLHQREMLSGKVQILSSSPTSASQDQGCPIPGQPGCSSSGCSHRSCHGE